MSKWAYLFLNDLFDVICSNNLNVVLLRSYEWLSDVPVGDIDLLIEAGHLSRTKTVLNQFAENNNWLKIFENKDANHTHLIFYQVSNSKFKYVHFDVQTSLGRKGFTYCPSLKVMANPKLVDSIKTQSYIDSVTSLILHVLMDKKFVKDAYREKIIAVDINKLNKILQDIIGKKLTKTVSEWINEGLPDSKIAAIKKKLRRYLVFKYPENVFAPIIHKIFRISRYFFKRQGMLIAALGPDGAGKSTVIEGVQRMITIGAFPVATVYMGKRETYLPTSKLIRLYYDYKEKKKAGGDSKEKIKPLHSIIQERNNDTDQTYLNSIKEFLGLTHWFVELWIRYLVKIRPILQQGGVVLCDRYIYDLANRPVYSVVYKKPFFLLLKAMYPIPDLTYFFWAEPEVLYRRKMENTVEENINLIKNYRIILSHIPNVFEIQTNIDSDKICYSVSNDVLKLMKQK